MNFPALVKGVVYTETNRQTENDLRRQGVRTQVNYSELVKGFSTQRQTYRQKDRERLMEAGVDNTGEMLWVGEGFSNTETDRQIENDSRRQGVMTQVNCPALVKVFFDTDRQTDRQTDGRTDGRTDRQADRQAGRQTDRKTEYNLWRQGMMTQVNCSELMRVFFPQRQTDIQRTTYGGRG